MNDKTSAGSSKKEASISAGASELMMELFNRMPGESLKSVPEPIAKRIGDFMVANGYRVVFDRWYLQAEPHALETNSAPLFPPTEPWPSSLGEQCPQYWGRLERRCQLTEGHEGACYFCVPAYAIRTDIQIDGPSAKALPPHCSCDPNPSIGGSPPCLVHDGESEGEQS